jgi:hypothetical protein
VFDINQPAPGALQAAPRGTSASYLRHYKGYSAIQQEQSNGSAVYSSLQASWNRRFTSGFFAGVSYTWSKSLDNSSNYRDIMPYTAFSNNLWGPSEYDTRNIFIVNYLYQLPFFTSQQTLVGKLLGGWSLSGNTQFQSGTPCGVGGGSNDYAGVGEVGSFGCGGNTTEGQFWVRNGTPSMPKKFGGNGTHAKYFNPTNGNGQPIFTPPPAGTFNLQYGIRDEIYQPGLQNWNLNMFKKFAINERTGFEFRAEAYNFVNHPNWASNGPSAPSGQTGGLQMNPTSSQFGEVTQKSVGNPRTLQLSLRYSF